MEAHLAEMEEEHEEDTRGGYTRDKLDADVLQAMIVQLSYSMRTYDIASDILV